MKQPSMSAAGAGHSSGPWHVGVKQAEKIVYDSTGWAVAFATVYHGESDAAEVLSNARLIAAAPDLLGALQSVLQHCVTVNGMPDKGKGRTAEQQSALDNARAAIQKATS